MSDNSELPTDMRDLLIRLDVSVDRGFKQIFDKLDEMTRRSDLHEDRIRNLEQQNTTRASLVQRFYDVEVEVGVLKEWKHQSEGASSARKPWMEKVIMPALVLLFGLLLGALGVQKVESAINGDDRATEQVSRP